MTPPDRALDRRLYAYPGRNEGTWARVWRRDDATRERTLFLGELGIWNTEQTIGRDDANLLVLDAPEVAPVHLRLLQPDTLEALAPGAFHVDPGSHPAPRAVAPGGVYVGGRDFDVGPFRLRLETRRCPTDEAPPDARVGEVRLGRQARFSLARARQCIEATFRWLETLPAERWFRPDDAVAQFTPEARAWAHERLDAHHAALSLELVPPGGVVVVRSFWDLLDAWAAAWSTVDPDGAGASLAYLHALGAAADRLDEPEGRVFGLVLRRVFSLDPHETLWPGDLASALYGLYPEYRTCDGARPAEPQVLHLVHWHALRIRFGVEAPSPWLPLLDLWNHGAWPVALPDRRWCLYAPVWQDGALCLAPGVPPTPRRIAEVTARYRATRGALGRVRRWPNAALP